MAKIEATPRLLVVDDNPDNRIILRRRFTRLGYEVMEAGDGAKALALIAAFPFDLVMLDIMMPGIDGLEVLRRVRETRSQAELPIIMVTGKSASEDVVEALNLGANDYITKPVDIEVAYARAEMQLRRKREDDGKSAAFRDLEQTLTKLQEAVTQAENTSALLADLGADVRAPMAGVLGAATVLTRICDTPDLKKVVAVIEAAAASLDGLMSDALETGDRRDAPPKNKIRVLSADDDAVSRHAMREMLHAAAVEVELVDAPGGLEAAAVATGGIFDLVLMNVEMPDGLAGLRELRRTERERGKRRTPILAVSLDNSKAAKALAAGADLHMARPITAAGLLTAIAAALSRESEDLSAVA
ncbi:MAG: putative response regulator receiver domain protein [Phenylobacterium sp.]|jgi:DNA-binding response OmpR family regulator|nr:putative response regulator receiver domain protein [Phenylobacterium sp.]